MEYIAVLEGLNGLQFTQQSSRKSVGSNSWKSAGGKAPGCVSCDYELSAECTYEASADCGYEMSAPCEYEMSAPCEYEGSFDCNAPCGDPIPAYVPPPQMYLPTNPGQDFVIPPQGQQPGPSQQYVQPMPQIVPVGVPTPPAVQYQLTPPYLPPPGVVTVPALNPCGPREEYFNGTCTEIKGINLPGLRGKLGRLGKIFGK